MGRRKVDKKRKRRLGQEEENSPEIQTDRRTRTRIWIGRGQGFG